MSTRIVLPTTIIFSLDTSIPEAVPRLSQKFTYVLADNDNTLFFQVAVPAFYVRITPPLRANTSGTDIRTDILEAGSSPPPTCKVSTIQAPISVFLIFRGATTPVVR